MKFDYVFGENVEFMYPNVSIHIERIYPHTASEMLKTNVHNRDKYRNAIKKVIEDGLWKLNGATIVWSDDGILLDGQTRLQACVDSGKPIDVIVVRGIDTNAQMSMDTGKKRSVVDYLKLLGYKNATHVGAIGTALYRVDMNDLHAAAYKPNGSDSTVEQTVDWIVNNYEGRILPVYPYVDRTRRSIRGVSAGVIAAIADDLLRNGVSQDDVSDFFQQLSGSKEPCQPVRMLRDRLMKNAYEKGSKLPTDYIAAFIIKAWNAYITGDRLNFLRYSKGGAHPETFPSLRYE